MTDPKAIDISPEAVGERVSKLRLLAISMLVDARVAPSLKANADLLSALSTALSEARGKVGEAERERDEAQDAIRREVTAANLQFFSRKTDELGAALLKAEAEIDSMRDERSKLDQILDRLGIADTDLDPVAYVESVIQQRDDYNDDSVRLVHEKMDAIVERDAALSELEKLRGTLESARNGINLIGTALLDFHGDDLHGVVTVAINTAESLRVELETAIPSRSQAAADVIAERQRQISAEGWTAEHDDQHADESMARAAVCYAMPDGTRHMRNVAFARGRLMVPAWWPDSWALNWWKPKDRRRDLVRAGALIIAEIERLDRAAAIRARGEEKDR